MIWSPVPLLSIFQVKTFSSTKQVSGVDVLTGGKVYAAI